MLIKSRILQNFIMLSLSVVAGYSYLWHMKQQVPILCITGSDSTGASGIQADIKTVKELGAYAVTAVTSVTVQNASGIHGIYPLSPEAIVGQIRDVYEDCRPRAVKVGMLFSPASIRYVRDEIVGSPNIVCSPGILSSHGRRLMDDDSVRCFCREMVPLCRVLMLKCNEAEVILDRSLGTSDDMLRAAKSFHEMGAEYVMLRGGMHSEGRVGALLSGDGADSFFSSFNVEGWQRHGVGGALSTAIATRLALGDDVAGAVSAAHDYIHSRIVYSVESKNLDIRPRELYNRFLSLVPAHCSESHDVGFYASRLAISARYLAQVTRRVSDKSPKQIIDACLLHEVEMALANTSLSVQEISDRYGFSSLVVFSRFFKERKHCSPTEFRRSSR